MTANRVITIFLSAKKIPLLQFRLIRIAKFTIAFVAVRPVLVVTFIVFCTLISLVHNLCASCTNDTIVTKEEVAGTFARNIPIRAYFEI